MQMMHKLAPAQQLPDKPFRALQGNLARLIRRRRLRNEVDRPQQGQVQRRRRQRVEQVRMRGAHRILPRPEVRQHLLQGKLPGTLRVGPRHRDLETFDVAEVLRVPLLDQGDHLQRDRIGREARPLRNGYLTTIRFTVLRVIAPLATDGLRALHQKARLAAHGTVKAIHQVVALARRVLRIALLAATDLGLAKDRLEVFSGRHPRRILHLPDSQPALFSRLAQLHPQLTLCRAVHEQLVPSPALLQRQQAIAEAHGGHPVHHAASSAALLQREMPHRAQHQHQFLLVVIPPRALGPRFHQDHHGLLRLRLAQRPHAVMQPVIGHIDPTSLARFLLCRLILSDLLGKRDHRAILSRPFGRHTPPLHAVRGALSRFVADETCLLPARSTSCSPGTLNFIARKRPAAYVPPR